MSREYYEREFAALDAARMAYAFDAEVWETVATAMPDLEDERVELSKKLRETIDVSRIVLMKL